ncbi:MAG: hypothetical protein II553_06395, partial [Lachnospiraceae bacterium]|nr:hypothetical protein [Lachnospiraceae bacterium]
DHRKPDSAADITNQEDAYDTTPKRYKKTAARLHREKKKKTKGIHGRNVNNAAAGVFVRIKERQMH